MLAAFQTHLHQQLANIRAAGTYKRERVIVTPQGTTIRVADGQPVLNFCANNYLGLAQHPAVTAAAHEALERWGYGCASVRFICGTQGVHKQLEAKLSEFLGTEDTILYGSCFDANGGLFETLLGPEDAIISDELNHASIIDGIRLCKAQRHRYRNNDMADLEAKLQEAAGARCRLIATDGVFSMDGYIANLAAVCDLADKYQALVMVDDSHAVGFLGRTGRGSHRCSRSSRWRGRCSPPRPSTRSSPLRQAGRAKPPLIGKRVGRSSSSSRIIRRTPPASPRGCGSPLRTETKSP